MAPSLSLTEIHLLKKELEAQWDLLTQERLDRQAEIDNLRLEIESLKQTLRNMNPAFVPLYEETYSDLLQTYNPEMSGQA